MSPKRSKIGGKPCLCSKDTFYWKKILLNSQEIPFLKTHSYEVLVCPTHNRPWGNRRKEIIRTTCLSPLENYTLNKIEISFFESVYQLLKKGKISEKIWNAKLIKAFSNARIESKTRMFIQLGFIYQEEVIYQSSNRRKYYILFTEKGKADLKEILNIRSIEEIIDFCKGKQKDLDLLKKSKFINDKRVKLIYNILIKQIDFLDKNLDPYFKIEGEPLIQLSKNSDAYIDIFGILFGLIAIISENKIVTTSEFDSLFSNSKKVKSYRTIIEQLLKGKLIMFNVKKSSIFSDEEKLKEEFKKELRDLIDLLELMGRDFIVDQIIDNKPEDYSVSDCWDYCFKPIHKKVSDKITQNKVDVLKMMKCGIRAMLKNIYFSDIKPIIIRKKNWRKFLSKLIPNRDAFGKKYHELNDLRNSLMHPEKDFKKNLPNRLRYSFDIYQIFSKN